jgi:hypothetical protein
VQRFTFLLLIVGLALGGCARAPRERASVLPDSATAAIALDRPERPLVPLAGGGTLRLERVTLERAGLEISQPPPQVAVTPAAPSPEPPAPEADEPPAPEPAARGPADARTLLPPIPRGAPSTTITGRAADAKQATAHVTLDVRVDEQGDVSDAMLVESDADSVTVHAAIEAAEAVRYHPALLGGRPVAVWTRQVLEVRRGSRR